MYLEQRSINSFQMPYRGYVLIMYLHHLLWPTSRSSLMNLPQDVYNRIADLHNSIRGRGGLKLCKRRFRMINKQHVKNNLEPEEKIPDRMINEFLRQSPYCQITNRLRIPIKAHRFTCASYSPFEVLHLDNIGPLSLMPSHDGLSCSPPSLRQR